MRDKANFEAALKAFTETLAKHVSTADGQWTVKGFIDTLQNVYTISSDTKIVSKILEIHLFPKILTFAEEHGFVKRRVRSCLLLAQIQDLARVVLRIS